ncbi:NADH-quinone oxidoreductase subunit N [Bacillus kwashiorkori]|uniref:NADH-quinone oxidoreductase subunit N n=1 Tax=Bacillus kwashiorkori TaxID=1522318 RepID=UPI0007841111|nr:NADH-quinone oxidoreductase subunit N [Bacillus kwashiorkori]
MDMETLLSFQWGAMLPEFIILGTATILAILDLFLSKKVSRTILGWLGAAGIAAALISLAPQLGSQPVSILFDTFYLDGFAIVFKFVLLLGTLLLILLATGSNDKEGMEKYKGEYYYLLLTALLGGLIITSSLDMLTLFIGLELLSISSYILVALRKKSLASSESGMKYVLNGGIASAITLFGFSYLYGVTGTSNLREMGVQIAKGLDASLLYLVLIACIFVLVGLSFKMATIPYHMWAPDVYEGAPTIVTGFLSVVSKAAGFVLFIRLVLVVFPSIEIVVGKRTWSGIEFFQDIFILVAIITMFVGNIMAIRQRNVKRMLAYSSIGHAGFLLAGFATLSVTSMEAVWFYLLAYTFMTVGVFAIIYVVTEKNCDRQEQVGSSPHVKGSADISHFAGLYRTSPWMAVMMTVFLLSLAGIPGTAGFIAKLQIIMSALNGETMQFYLVVSIIIATILSYVYYFSIIIQLFFRPAATEVKPGPTTPFSVIIGFCVFATIWLGILPNTALDFFTNTFQSLSFFLE